MAVVTGVYELPAKQGAVYPLVAFNMLSAVDVVTADISNRIMSNQLWVIRGIVDDVSFAVAKTIAKRIDAVLQGSNGTADGATIYACHREESFRLVEDDNGKQFRHSGGIYRVQAQNLN
jgi:hypothetical protein